MRRKESYIVLVKKLGELGKPGCRWEDNIKILIGM
jgi:hypothetical protein